MSICIYEVSYRKTMHIEKETDETSGYLTTDNYTYDEGKKQFNTLNEVKTFIHDEKQYQSSDENSDKYSNIDFMYIDHIDPQKEPSICGIVINNTYCYEKNKTITSYDDDDNEIETNIPTGVIETDTTWIEVYHVSISDVSTKDLILLVNEKE